MGSFLSIPSTKGHLPDYVLWAVSLLIPVLVACVNYFMVVSDLAFVNWKYENGQALLQSRGLALSTIAMAGMSVMFGSVAALLVVLVAPSCAGSGIPEVLGFLNGNELPGIFSIRSSLVRIFGIIATQAAGFPIGREGPMVSIGGGIGFAVASLLVHPWEKRSEKSLMPDADDDDGGEYNLATSSTIMNQERFAHMRRIGCALGGAAGIATAFNAPIGGILYMFEELRTSSLAPKFHIFMCTVVGAFTMRMLLEMTNMDVHRLVIYDSSKMNESGAWDWVDVPVFLLLSAFLGGAASLASCGAIQVWTARFRMAKKRSKKCQPWAKFAECMCYCALCACVFNLVPSLVGCTGQDAPAADALDAGHRRLEGSLTHVQHTCADNEYNEVATLLLQGAEGAVKHLYSRSANVQGAGALLVTLLTYGTLALGMPGLCVPMGTFVPSMLIGGIVGRLVGQAATSISVSLGVTFAPAGVYAVVGSAAMLSGFTHMTVGIVVLLAEAINDLGLIVPLMAAVYVANFVSRSVSPHGYDEQLIIKKGVPFIESDLPQELDASRLTALDICYIPPRDAHLPRKSTIRMIKRALRHREVNYFPIVEEGGQCAGMTTRGRLKAVLTAVKDHPILGRRQITTTNSDGAQVIDDSQSEGTMQTTSTSSSFMTFPWRWGQAKKPAVDDNLSRMSSRSSTNTQGHLSDRQSENKMKGMIKEMFSKPETIYMNDDEEDDGLQEHHLLPIDRIMDPAPYMIDESMPVQRWYSLFRNVDMNVVCVLSREGRFSGFLTRRCLIAATERLHHGHVRPIQKAPEPFDDLQVKSPRSDCSQDDCAIGRPHAGLRTPSDTDAGSSSQYGSSESEFDTGDEESHHTHDDPSGTVPNPGATAINPKLKRHNSRINSKTSQGSQHSRMSRNSKLSKSPSGSSMPSSKPSDVLAAIEARRQQPTSTQVSSNTECSMDTAARSAAAMTMAEMLGPSELRGQLAAAWSQLAASEQKHQRLLERVGETEQQRDELLARQGRISPSTQIRPTSPANYSQKFTAMDTCSSSWLAGGDQTDARFLRDYVSAASASDDRASSPTNSGSVAAFSDASSRLHGGITIFTGGRSHDSGSPCGSPPSGDTPRGQRSRSKARIAEPEIETHSQQSPDLPSSAPAASDSSALPEEEQIDIMIEVPTADDDDDQTAPELEQGAAAETIVHMPVAAAAQLPALLHCANEASQEMRSPSEASADVCNPTEIGV